MPWKESSVSEQRLALVQLMQTHALSVQAAAARFGVSPKTAYKWLARAQAQGPGSPLTDRSRRPRHSPGRSAAPTEQAVLAVRDRYGWGARKIRAYLQAQQQAVPSRPTVHQILCRHGRVGPPTPTPPPRPPQRFERSEPNQLWQLDFKGPLELGRRVWHPLTILDDHSRYLLTLRLHPDLGLAGAWQSLWELCGEVGLPEALLCDRAFGGGGAGPRTLSWFEIHLLRLGVRPVHGRAGHPQTQGKVERVHGTFEAELYPRCRRDHPAHFQQDAEAWRQVYNGVRPHEALDDQPPVTRWRPSPRPRPAVLPEVVYPAAAVLRKVSRIGEVRWHCRRILAGGGLAGQYVRLEEQDLGLALYYGDYRLRLIPKEALVGQRLL